MPEDSKKQQKKGKSDAKEQRKQRQPHHHNVPAASDKKIQKKTERSEVPIVVEKSVIEDPGPEFYKNLKRETDEILKITEEANIKYRKKEIQSNWSKYEIPIESYEDIEEQENLGADYEKLIEAPLSIGGHFQFKHEKSWNIDIGPSLYDKYFEINMDNLGLALQTVPFYERNDLDKNMFSESDILNMNNRSTRYKQKFYKDNNSFTAPEKELNPLKDDFENLNVNESDKICDKIDEQQRIGPGEKNQIVKPHNNELEEIENKIRIESGPQSTPIQENKELNTIKVSSDNEAKGMFSQVENDFDEIFLNVKPIQTNIIDNSQKLFFETAVVEAGKTQKTKPALATATVCPEKEQKNQIIESPEDLEKWLDEFLE